MIPNQSTNATLLNREEAANYLGVSPSTLANWACTKKYQIKFIRVGRSVRYRQCDLDAFVLRGEVE